MNEEINELSAEYGIGKTEAEEILETRDSLGIDTDDAVEVYENL